MKSNIFNFWSPIFKNNNTISRNIKNFVLNFGPQHPASHGVLRLIVQLNGELVERSDAHIGFLHRGTEKLIEQRKILQSLPYFDRLDYVSMMTQEHAFCLTIENLLNSVSFSSIYSQIRVLFDELTRILNHLLAISTHSLDVGNMVPIFWAFEEREFIMEFYERVSGARMHAAFYRPNELNLLGINNQLLLDIIFFIKNYYKSLTEIFITLVNNKIWKTRLVNIGTINFSDSLTYGLTGPIIRSVGIKKDLRLIKNETYSFYWFLILKSFLGKKGDSYDRFLIRIREMYESIIIILQIVFNLTNIFNNKNNYFSYQFFNFLLNNKQINIKKNNKYNLMETLIKHFKYFSENLKLQSGFSYKSVEAPKGELGVSIITDNSINPYRCKIRSPSFNHIQIMSKIVKGHFFADLVTVLGSQDIVFGDVDR